MYVLQHTFSRKYQISSQPRQKSCWAIVLCMFSMVSTISLAPSISLLIPGLQVYNLVLLLMIHRYSQVSQLYSPNEPPLLPKWATTTPKQATNTLSTSHHYSHNQWATINPRINESLSYRLGIVLKIKHRKLRKCQLQNFCKWFSRVGFWPFKFGSHCKQIVFHIRMSTAQLERLNPD